MVSAKLMALAKGSLLLASTILSVGLAAPRSRVDLAHPHASAAEVSGGDLMPSIGACSQDPDHVLTPPCEELACEDVEGQGTDGWHEPATDDPAIELPTVWRPARGLEPLLVGRDAVDSHAARGPPAA